MSAAKIRVLVVDDSALLRELATDYLGACGDIEVVGAAADGHQALALFSTLRPDVVTLDVLMPDMDGLATLDALLAIHPTPVVMFSSLTQLGANAALDALDRGAFDYVGKPGVGEPAPQVIQGELARKVRLAAGVDMRRIMELRRRRKQQPARAAKPVAAPIATDRSPTRDAWAGQCVAIGISTGGPPALARLFEALHPPLPPIVVVQHMPPQFTRSLAWRLNSLSALNIREAAEGDVLAADGVWLAPGGRHLQLQRSGGQVKVQLHDKPQVSGHRPSVDVMMTSAAALFGPGCLGVIMTGMGHDGVEGCRAIRAAGGYVLGQDEATSEVYGMNKAAWVEHCVDRQFALGDAATLIARETRRMNQRTAVAAP